MNMNGYCGFLQKRGKIILPIIFLLIVFSIFFICKVNIQTDFKMFSPTDSKFRKGGELMTGAFGDEGQLLFSVPFASELNAGVVRDMLDLIEKCEEIPGVNKVLGAFPASLKTAGDREIQKQIAAMKALESGNIKSIYNGPDGNFFLLRILLADGANIRDTVKAIKKVGGEKAPGYALSGEPYLESEMFAYILRILLILPPIAIFLILLVFRLRIGSFRATMLSMVPAVISAALALGLLSMVKGNITIMSALVPIYIIVLGSADGLHVTSHVMDQLGKGMSNNEAITQTLKAVGTPIILTSLTTMAGFLSLTTIKSAAIREMAVTAAIGILLAGLVTWIVLPILLFHQKPLPARTHKNKSGLKNGLKKLIGAKAVILSLIVLTAAAPGLFKVKANFSMTDMYKPGTEVRKSIDLLTRQTGGAYPLMVMVKGGSLFDQKTASGILAYQDKIESEGMVSSSISIYRLVESFSGMFFNQSGYPNNASMAGRIASQIEKQNPDMYQSLVGKEGWTRLILYAENLRTDTLENLTESFKELAEELNIEVYPAGSAFEMMQMNTAIIPQEAQSLLIALAAVFILTALFNKSLKAGAASLVPIIIALCGLFGVMGYARIDLSVITVIMSGLTIGVGIDYAIHYTSLYLYFKRNKKENPALVAFDYVATPVLANALGLSIGFSAMIFSPLQIHATLSVLMWTTMVLSSVLSLSLLPTILGAKRKIKPGP